jgi:hypothetical protein
MALRTDSRLAAEIRLHVRFLGTYWPQKGINFDGLPALDFTAPFDRARFVDGAVQFGGQVRAADQIVPGATVTACRRRKSDGVHR